MKITKPILFLVPLTLASAVFAQKGTQVFPKPVATNLPPPVYVVDPPPPPIATLQQEPAKQTYVYDQKPLANRPVLITPDLAQTIIDRFKAAYPKLGSPRLLIYVNRELVNEQGGLKLLQRKQHVESFQKLADTNANASVKTVEEKSYQADDKLQATLADKQTVRDVERLFGRPLRSAGATLVDQKVASALIADKPIAEFVGTTDTPESRKDREAIAKVADAVIEVLVSSKTLTVPTLSGDQSIIIPDLQATAISLKDSKILGQASSSEVTGRVPASALGNFDVREITEATALALMEDMTPAP